MSHHDQELLRVALAVSDRASVDWENERTARPEAAPLLEELRLIESVTQTHAGVDATGDGAAAPGRLPPGRAEPDLAETWGSLRLIERIGRGAFGEVIRAFDPMLEREVALKLLTRDRSISAQEQFLAEARRLARVRHPNVLTVHGADRHHDRVGMWTDLVSGATLESILQRQGPFGAGETIAVGVDLCRALAAVHTAGLVHRDVKAANVMREQGGRIVLMDFGSGTESGAEGEAGGGMFGTPIVMAPEQLRGEPSTPVTDLYGLGALLYRLASGRYPIEAKTLEELRAQHAQGGFVPLADRRPDLPPALVRVVERALDPEPARRFASAGAMEQALAACLEPVPGEPPTGESHRPRSALPRGRWLLLGAALLAAVLAWLRPWEPSRPRDSVSGTTGSKAAPGIAETGVPPVPALSASAQLFRERASGTESLVSGARITPGDGLFLRFQAAEPVYAYVLNEDEGGQLVVLFPAPGLDLTNPLAAAPHRLPGTRRGEPFDWQVTSAGGNETVIVVASRQPLEELERDLAGLPRPTERAPIVYGRPSQDATYRLRGIAGTIARREIAPGSRSGRLSDLLRGLPNSTAASSDVWMWQIELANPKP